ncbi:MAG: oligosaccharide flippase family protein, partial [Lachnospiraceae bacterium]
MKIRSVKFNFIMNFILTASAIIFPLITFPYISRVLGAVGNGKVAFAASVVTYFAMFASLGIPTYGIRACAKVRDDREELS